MRGLPDALILDFGGVLYDIDYDAPIEAFRVLGVEDFGSLYQQTAQAPVFDELECGRISAEDFYRSMELHCRPETTRQEIVDAWNCILIGMDASRVNMVRSLSEQTRLFIFSNTNAIHADVFENWIETNVGWQPFADAFEAIHYSHELGVRKPEPEAFLSICERHHLVPERTLFIDDSKQHTEGAKSAGLESHWHHPVELDVAHWLVQRGFELPQDAFR